MGQINCASINQMLAEAASAQFATPYARALLLVYSINADQVRVESFTAFTDTSGRSPYRQTVVLTRAAGNSTNPNLALRKSLFRRP